MSRNLQLFMVYILRKHKKLLYFSYIFFLVNRRGKIKKYRVNERIKYDYIYVSHVLVKRNMLKRGENENKTTLVF